MQDRVFDSFENREKYMREQLGTPIPSRQLSPTLFFAEIRAGVSFVSLNRRNISLIPANPFDCLAFDRVDLVLKSVPGFDASKSNVQKIAEEYGIESLLDRYIYSLSGGEALKLGLAKASLELNRMQQLGIAAPWNSLSQDGYKYIERLSSAYENRGKLVELLSLEGDQQFDAAEGETPTSQVSFGIETSNVEILLSDPDRHTSLPRAIFADFHDERLESPCHLSGSNGQGKSLLAKALSNAIEYSGTIRVRSSNKDRVRLVFQDVSSQMLLSASSLELELRANSAAAAYKKILDNSLERKLPRGSFQENSLLAIKVSMIAVRVGSQPSLLILDEPDWGLTKRQAVELMRATVELCHLAAVPLVIVSHRKWFDRFYRSQIRIGRKSINRRGDFIVEMVRTI